MMAQAFAPSLGKRVRAILRLACRVLGLKRRKGLGLALLGTMAVALMSGAPARAANGIHINANARGSCVSINDPQSVYIVGGSTDVYLRENVNFTDNAARCNPVGGAGQYGYILFSPRVDVTSVGATSLTLGGQLSVNSGFIKLGDDTTGQRIGNLGTAADPLGLAIGNSTQAQKWGVGLGLLARATGAEAATAAGNNTQASASYSTVLGVAGNVSSSHASVLGASSVIRGEGEYAVGVGRFTQIISANAIAFGRNSIARSLDSVAIGMSTNAADRAAIALGGGSQTSAAVEPQGVLLLGVSPAFSATHLDGVVSVGSVIRNRQVINVAPGVVQAQSTDAVNGAQLFAAYDAINILGATDQAQQAALARNAAGLAAARGEQAATSASFARAVGGGAAVDEQGGVVMPRPAANAGGATEQPATVLGAVTALDRTINQQDERLGETFDQTMALIDKVDLVAAPLQGLGPDETVAGRIDDVKKALLMWDPVRGVYTATPVSDEQHRISNLAAGQAATDAVNKGQLDQAIAELQGSSLVRESDGQLRVGQDSSATSVSLAGGAPRRDADGNPVVGADGQPLTAAVDRQVTGVAAGVNANDAVNKGQLDGVAQAATAAQGAAGDARQTADAAGAAASAAQRTADAAQGAAADARQAATAAQGAAAAAQSAADGANAKLAGIGAGETVAGRIEQAATAATDAAGRAAGQALADALGGGASVGADGKASAPAYAISQIGPDGTVAAQPQAASNVGAALTALDANVVKVNDRVLAQDGKLNVLTRDLAELRDDSLLWDPDAQAFSASHGGASPNRILNVADGQADTDAVNKGQLSTVSQSADAAAAAAGAAQSVADTARDGANRAQQAATAAQDTAASARQAAETADGEVARTWQAAQAAQGAAGQAQQQAASAQGRATQAQQRAETAREAAMGAGQAAGSAQEASAQARDLASAAQHSATAARGAAEAAQQAAGTARASADDASARLAGIDEGETVARRIAQATQAAVASAGQAASQALAGALGGGATVGADGQASAPGYAISQFGADGTPAAQAQTATNVGDALAALDANVIKVNERVLAQGADAAKLTQDLDGLRDDGLRWDAAGGAFNAAREDGSANRIAQVAAGVAASDAINLGQVASVAGTVAAAADVAGTARQTADAAQVVASAAGQSADAAQSASAAAQQSADAANAMLVGIGEGETVAGRIAQAAAATNQSLANALGGGATIDADGALQAPAYAVTAIGPDGRAQAPATAAGNVAEAVRQLDASVVAVNDNVNQVGADLSRVRDQLDAGELGLVRQDAASRDITVARQADSTRVTLAGTDGVRTLSGVKAGEVSAASTEAVVGAQLFRVNQDLLANSQAVGDLEALTGQQGVTLTALSDRVDSGNVGLTRHDPSGNRVTLAADRGGDAVDVSGTDGARRVTGLRDGDVAAGSTDAATGGQLHAVTERIDQLDAQAAGIAIDSRGDGSDRAQVKAGGRGVAVGASAQAMGDNSAAVGAEARAAGANATAMGANAAAQAAGSTAVGANATASAPGSVALGEGAQATRANTVSVGVAGAERQITNVAAATHATDAVNLRQAIQLSRQDANQARQLANRHTDSRIGQLRRETRAGVASAMAMAALPATSTPGKSMVAMSASSYGGQSAVAVGVSARSRSGTWVYRLSLSGAAGGQTGASAGLTYAW